MSLKIEDLTEANVVSFFLDQRHTYFEMALIAEGGARYEIQANNADGSRIGVSFGQLRFVGNFSTLENMPSLGELEGVQTIENGVILEGDFGDVTIHANNIVVKTVAKAAPTPARTD